MSSALTCELCAQKDPPVSVTCPNVVALRQHTYAQHGGGSVMTTCRFCPFVETKTKVVSHERRCSAQPPRLCEPCGMTLKNTRSLSKHARSQAHLDRVALLAAQPTVKVVLPQQLTDLLLANAASATLPPPPPPAHSHADPPSPSDFEVFDVGGDDWQGINDGAQEYAADARPPHPPGDNYDGVEGGAKGTTLDLVFQHDAVRRLMQSRGMHASFWQSRGTNRFGVKVATMRARANHGLALMCTYIKWLVERKATMTAVSASLEQLVDISEFNIGAEIADALYDLKQSVDRNQFPSGGSPTVFLALTDDREKSVADLIARLNLTRTTVHTAFAMCAAICRWLLRCVCETAHARKHYAGAKAFFEGFEMALTTPAKQLTSYKSAMTRRASTNSIELWNSDAEAYLNVLYAFHGELLYHMQAELNKLTNLKDVGVEQASVVARRTWSLIAVLCSGVGAFAARKGLG
jgi:hypothetical protein